MRERSKECGYGELSLWGSSVRSRPVLRDHRHVSVVVATRDFHPPGHCSFTTHGGRWPPHCVIATPGAALHPDIDAIAHVFVSKGTNPALEQYSGFDGTGLGDLLRARRSARDHRRPCHRLLRTRHGACRVWRGFRHHSLTGRGARGGPQTRRRRSSPRCNPFGGRTGVHTSRDPEDFTGIGRLRYDRVLTR
jgi:hypothetical protein